MTDSEAADIREYLDENPRHLHAAFAVHRAWPGVREEVYRRFLERLRDRVEKQLAVEIPGTQEDFQVGCHYEGANQSVLNVLWITRISWMEYVDAPERARLTRTSILFQSHGKGMNNWRWGVRSPKPQGQMTKAESERRLQLESGTEDLRPLARKDLGLVAPVRSPPLSALGPTHPPTGYRIYQGRWQNH